MTVLLIVLGAALLTGALLFLAVCLSAGKRWPDEDGDCILVLGARVKPDGRMTNTLLSRCRTALQAWQDGRAKYMILCGGKAGDEPVPEAWLMRDWMLEHKVPIAALRLEDSSVNTFANMTNARAIMQREGWKRALVLTSDYHLRRALWMAADCGISAGGIPAPTPRRARTFIKSRLRETCSWILYFRYKYQKKWFPNAKIP